MKPFSGSGFTRDSLILAPSSPQGVALHIMVTSLRERLNYAVNGANSFLNQQYRGAR